MSRKIKLILTTIMLVLTMLFTLAARGLDSPLAQMDMPTETLLPPSAIEVQITPSPEDTSSIQAAASPTMTSIFTGFTPYPEATYGSYGPMGGSGMGGGCAGMSGVGGMGMSSDYYTNTLTTGGMGSGGMDTSSCPMMSGSMNMSGGSMSGMNMSGADIRGMDMSGYDLSELSGYVTTDSASVFSNPWVLIGWVLLGLLVLAILAGIGIGIAWLVRRSRPAQTT